MRANPKTNPTQSPLIRGGEVLKSEKLTPLIRGGLKAPSPDKGRGGEGFGFESVFLPYNKNLTQHARENRSNPTKAESKIWGEFRGHNKIRALNEFQ